MKKAGFWSVNVKANFNMVNFRYSKIIKNIMYKTVAESFT